MKNDPIDDSPQEFTWYEQIARDYTLQQRKDWYSNAAEAYDKTRPRYPSQLVRRAVELAQLPEMGRILEVGCGPGIATLAFARLGFSILALEPSAAACDRARRNCAEYSQVAIANTTFEAWELGTETFDAVLGATSFHWISPDIAYPKAAAALKDGGSLILLWNTPPQPNEELYSVLTDVYRTHAPSVKPYETRETQIKNLQRLGQVALNSGWFRNLVSQQMVFEVTYCVEDYLTLLTTLSPYIMLEPERRDALLTALKEALERHCGRALPLSHLSVLQVVAKVQKQS